MYPKDLNVEMISKFVLIFLMLHQASGCMSPQYAELDETGLIHCNFLSNRNALYWRGNITSSSSSLIVYMVNGQKGGAGYESGEYDMLPNGSLVINRVTILHEKTYEAIIIDKTENSNNYYVNLTVTVTTTTKIPIITNCFQELCLADDHVDFLQCEVGGARPPAILKWFYVSSDGREVEYNSTHDLIQEEKHTFRSNSNISLKYNELGNGKLVSLYLCRATFPPNSLSYEKVVILDQSQAHWPSLGEPEMVYFQINLPAILTCQRREIGASYVWKKMTLKGTFETIAYRSPSHDNPINIGIYSVNEFGELVIADVSTETEGNYTCASSNSNSKLEIYELIVVVPPSASPNIVIDVCRKTGENECTVTSHGSGELRCTVSDVRPVISVEWSEDDDSNSKLEVFSSTLSVEEHSGLYTVTRLLEYSIASNIECNEAFPLKCIATGPATNFFDLKVAHVTLLNRQTHCPMPVSPEPTRSSIVWILITVVAIIIVLIAVSVKMCVAKYRRAINRDNSLYQIHREQRELLQTHGKYLEYSKLTTKRKQLLHDLKITYISQLDDSKVHVMNMFSKLNPLKSSADDERYVKLGSYEDIFGNDFMQNQRLVLEGEAGCGKSTFAMTIAREWINKHDESPMRDVGMLIILSLIDFDENTTIPEAMKKQIVPDDRQEEISAKEIEKILQNENKVIIFLDGFDEFVERNSEENENSYMYRLIRNKILNRAFIVILTRSVSYLRVYGEKILPIVKLHSFTNAQIQNYIKSSFSLRSDIDQLQEKVDSNDNLNSLCKIPLFLEMVTTMYKADHSFSISASKQTPFFKELIDKKFGNSKENDSLGYKPSDKIAELAFDAICKSKSFWLSNEIGENFGNELDMLISLNFFKKVSKSTQRDNCTKEHSIIQSTHNIYQYYLGAHFLSCVDTPEKLVHQLQKIDVLTCQHLLIFTCGLNAQCIIPIVRYLLDMEDIFPYPLRDCIAQCLTESDLEVNDEVKHLLKKLSMREHGIAILNTDNKPLKTAKSSLLNMYKDFQITVQFLRLVNLQLSSTDLQKLALLDNEADLYYQLPMLKTLILTDFSHTITDDLILSIVKNIPTVTEIAVFSTNKPSIVDEESKEILKQRERELFVCWIHYKDLKKNHEVREVELLYPSSNFQRWLSFDETNVVILMRKFKGFFGKVTEQEAVQVMADLGIKGFFDQVKLNYVMRLPYEQQSKEFTTMLSDILDLWQKIDDASRSQDVDYYSKKLEDQLKSFNLNWHFTESFSPIMWSMN